MDFRLSAMAFRKASSFRPDVFRERIAEVLEYHMPMVCSTWERDAESIRGVLQVDLFTPYRDDVGVSVFEIGTPGAGAWIRAEGLSLALANKLCLLSGLGHRPASATDLYDLAACAVSNTVRPLINVSEIAQLLSNIVSLEGKLGQWKDDGSSYKISLPNNAHDQFADLRHSVFPSRWISFNDAIYAASGMFHLVNQATCSIHHA
ncbi:MAG: hypothetical protein QM770_01590 [Tepidisphaeraceae bacterium]